MKIKQTTFYALLAIRRIYVENREIVTSKLISEKEGISQGVLLRILRSLDNAGIVQAHQGRGTAYGGFSLARNIDEITLLDVVNTMEKVDICIKLSEKDRKNEKELFLKCSQINERLKEELSKYTVRELFEL